MDDDKAATRTCDFLTVPAEGEAAAGASLPTYLIVVRGGILGAMLRISAGGTRIGRAPDNTFQWRDANISRYHALLRTDDAGAIWLIDLASTNGTFVNGRQVSCHTPSRLKDGDRIQFGTTAEVKFVRLEPPDEQFQRELFERSVRDPLTGLYNRAFFQSQIGPLAERYAARGLGLAVLMLDVDHFKRINDTYGHEAGDRVLRDIARVIREATRAEDLVARYGGEEFILALPAATPDQATQRAECIRANVANRRFSPGGPQLLRVTVSLGLSYASPDRFPSVRSLIAQADQCLYRAKRDGRNRVVLQLDTQPASAEASTEEAEVAQPELV